MDVKKIENIVCLILFKPDKPDKPDKDSPLRFYHIPRIRSKHGEDSSILSTERRKKWFSASKRSDINVNALHHIVCSVDFVSGKPASSQVFHARYFTVTMPQKFLNSQFSYIESF